MHFCDRDQMPAEKKREAALFAYDADVFLGSHIIFVNEDLGY